MASSHGKVVSKKKVSDKGKNLRWRIVYEDGHVEEQKWITRAGKTQEHDDHDLKQSVAAHRKIMLRKQLLPQAKEGAMYVPFIGDGDILHGLLSEPRMSKVLQDRAVFGADLDATRVETARGRFPEAELRVGDCDHAWPFRGVTDAFGIADFDAYSFPYHAFHQFWNNALKADRLVMFFTDGHRQSVVRSHWWHHPNGKDKEYVEELSEQRKIFHTYWPKIILPWFKEHVAVSGWKVVKTSMYVRGQSMYWGAVIDRT